MTFRAEVIRFLVLDAYDPKGRTALRRAGGTEAGSLYSRLLARVAPDASVDVLCPSDPGAVLPEGAALRSYDGVLWTGSNLSLGAEDRAARRHVELAREVFAAGVPSFGSCYAAQLAVVAAGGACRTHPAGREFGVSREIELTTAGREHPMFHRKPGVFDAWTSHADEIATLPPEATILASNAWSAAQAVVVRSGAGEFWAVQYHPEYDAHEIACLASLRADELIAQGTFGDAAAAAAWCEAVEEAARAPERATEAGLPPALLDPAAADCEISNWIEHLVLPARRR
ncbi:MAG: type 1 glutamine amidotransferase [Myxococcales bacterium]|nr:type 1 glutamine amidotransferase [Myxococcales bacterium]